MQKWEYCRIFGSYLYFSTEEGEKVVSYKETLYEEHKGSHSYMAPVIAGLGLRGWELVGVQYSTLYFKRPIVE